MAQNKSLSTQEVADILHVSKSTIYELIRRGEINSYKVGRKVRFTQDDVDAYIARSRHEQSVQPVRRVEISSELLSPAAASERPFVISGQDVVLDILSNYLHQSGIHADRCYLSSFEGLLALYEGKVDAAACHLYAVDEKSFNVPYVRRLMPRVKSVLVNISYRRQGFYVAAGNPKEIRGWRDLAIGTERISRQIEGLDFIPLLEERYDLVMRREALQTPAGEAILEILRSAAFKKEISHFTGNSYRDLGKIIAEV